MTQKELKYKKVLRAMHKHSQKDIPFYKRREGATEALQFALDLLDRLEKIEGSGILGEEREINSVHYLNGYPECRKCNRNIGYNECRKEISLRLLKSMDKENIKYIINDNVIPYTVRSKNECYVDVDKLTKAIHDSIFGGTK